MMKSIIVVLSLIIIMPISNQRLIAQDILETHKVDGWIIPGIEKHDQLKVIKQNEKTREGISIRESIYEPKRDRDGRRPHVKIPIRIKSNGNQKYEEKEVVVREIIEYMIDGKPFCFLIKMSPMDKFGNAIGKSYGYAYYDENGSGLFQTREPVGIIGGPSGWHLRIPEWVKQ